MITWLAEQLGPEGSVGQYDWLKAAVENGANPFTIATGAVMEADSLKRFN